MRDIDNALALSLEALNRLEQMLRFLFTDGRCRLVHEDHIGIVAERFGDFHELHLRNRQLAHHLGRTNVELQTIQKRLRFTVHLLEINAAKSR